MLGFLKKRLLFIILLILFLLPLSSASQVEAQAPPYSFASGWNEIFWSVGLPSFTAQTALQSIDSYCGSGTGLVVGQKEQDFWQDYVANYGGENFDLSLGQTYYLNLSRQCTWDPTTPPPSHYYGYATFTHIRNFRKPPDYPVDELEEIGSYTNYMFVYHSYSAQTDTHYPSATDLQVLREKTNIKLILNIADIAEHSYNETALRSLKNLLDDYKDTIYTIFVLDEPYKPERDVKYDSTMLYNKVKQVREIFDPQDNNEYLMMVNFLNPSYVEWWWENQREPKEPYPAIPDNIDVISFDTYYFPPNSFDELSPRDRQNCPTANTVQEYYKNCAIGYDIDILREKQPNKPLHFISTAFSCDGVAYCTEHCKWITQFCPENYEPSDDAPGVPLALTQAQWDYEIVVERDLAGLLWYYYDKSRGGYSTGAVEYPRLLDKHKEIGQLLIGGGR